MTSCGYLEFLSSFYFNVSSSLLSLLSWPFYTSIIVITTNSWTYSIDSQSDRVSGEYLLGWDLVVAGSRVDLSDLDHHRYGDDDVDGGVEAVMVMVVARIVFTFSRKGRTKMRPGPRTKAMSRVDPKTTARSYSGIWLFQDLLQQRQKVWSWYCCSFQVSYLLNKIIA